MKYLFYSEEPEEGGTVSVYPPPKNDQYEDGETVYLLAQPAKGWKLTHWSGCDCNGLAISVVMSEDRAIAAHFDHDYLVITRDGIYDEMPEM